MNLELMLTMINAMDKFHNKLETFNARVEGRPKRIEPIKPPFLITIYHGSCNLGDTIQSYALARLINARYGVYRHSMQNYNRRGLTHILSGYYGGNECLPQHSSYLFSGIYLERVSSQFLNWMKISSYPIGVRDSLTGHRLKRYGVKSEVIGCSSLTLGYSYGPRDKDLILNVDSKVKTGAMLTHKISKSMSWDAQWDQSRHMLALYSRASLVYTSRLHVALPCLSLGTPVQVDKPSNESAERLFMLEELGVKFGRVERWSEKQSDRARKLYVSFLRKYLTVDVHDPVRPIPINMP